MVRIIWSEGYYNGIPKRFLNLLFCFRPFSADPAITPINATGHQLASLCRSVCAEERAQILDPIVTS